MLREKESEVEDSRRESSPDKESFVSCRSSPVTGIAPVLIAAPSERASWMVEYSPLSGSMTTDSSGGGGSDGGSGGEGGGGDGGGGFGGGGEGGGGEGGGGEGGGEGGGGEGVPARLRILSFGAPPLRIAVASACPPSHWIELPLRKSLRRLPADLSSLLSATACRVARGGRGERRVARGAGGTQEGVGSGGGASRVQGGS